MEKVDAFFEAINSTGGLFAHQADKNALVLMCKIDGLFSNFERKGGLVQLN